MVAPVVVRVREFAPEVTKLAAISIFPASLIDLAALIISIVNDRPAVRATDEVAAIVTSKAAEVSRIPREVRAVWVPPAMVGDVPRTTLPEPVDAVNDVVVFAVPLPVEVKNAGCANTLPANLAREPGVPVADV